MMPVISPQERNPKSVKRKVWSNSEPTTLNSEDVKTAAMRAKTKNTEEEEGKGKATTNNRKRVTIPGGLPKANDPKEPSKDVLTTRRASRKNIQPAKPPSPDVIDLRDEKVVRELLLRLYKTLNVSEETAHGCVVAEKRAWTTVEARNNAQSLKQNEGKVEKYGNNGPDLRDTADHGMKLHRHDIIRFPQLRKSASNFQVFYFKPLSCEYLNTRQRRKSSLKFSAFQGKLLESGSLDRKETFKRNVCQLTRPLRDSKETQSPVSGLCGGGLSFPLFLRSSCTFVSRNFKTPFESRKSVTFVLRGEI